MIKLFNKTTNRFRKDIKNTKASMKTIEKVDLSAPENEENSEIIIKDSTNENFLNSLSIKNRISYSMNKVSPLALSEYIKYIYMQVEKIQSIKGSSISTDCPTIKFPKK